MQRSRLTELLSLLAGQRETQNAMPGEPSNMVQGQEERAAVQEGDAMSPEHDKQDDDMKKLALLQLMMNKGQ